MDCVNKFPLVSVIMPSYNKAEYIEKSIESVLSQSYEDFELVIIDDCSTDNSIDVINSIKDRRLKFYKNHSNIGIAENRNRGINLSRGKYIALLDADDISTPFRLEHEVAFLESNLDIDVVYGMSQEIDEHDVISRICSPSYNNPRFVRANLLIKNVIPNGTCMFRKCFIKENNIKYRNQMYGIEDYMFWIECSVKGQIMGLPEVYLYWRNYKNNTTNSILKGDTNTNRARKFDEVHKKALDLNGFKLNDDELNLYNMILTEQPYRIKDREELLKFYHIVKKLISQAKNMPENVEWEIMFKKTFGLCLEKSYIWD